MNTDDFIIEDWLDEFDDYQDLISVLDAKIALQNIIPSQMVQIQQEFDWNG